MKTKFERWKIEGEWKIFNIFLNTKLFLSQLNINQKIMMKRWKKTFERLFSKFFL
jgi:hypothetical protein